MDFLKSWIKSGSAKAADEAPRVVTHEARPDHAHTVVVEVRFE